jgi:long-chain acyl-CoA synthetase
MSMSEIRSPMGVSNGASDDDDRRWVSLYSPGMPAELTVAVESALDAFNQSLAASPEAVALWYFDTSLSFREVDQKARVLAAAWADTVKQGDRVAILNQNTPATVIGLLAAWRLGAAVMPLNPMLKRRELVHYLTDGQPSAIIVGAEQAAALQGAISDWRGTPAVTVAFPRDFLSQGQVPRLLEGLPDDFVAITGWSRLSELLSGTGTSLTRKVAKDDAALLTYTSGTTGQPKAALNSHANVAFNAEVYRRWLMLDPDDVLFAAAPFSHVTGLVAHIAAGFAAGAPVVMCYRFEPATVLDLLARRGCTSTVAAITAYIALLDHPSFDASRLTRLRKLFSGGAPVAPAVVERWEAATGVYIHNAYGLTETTSPSHLVPFGRRAPVDELTGALSVGVPVPGTRCRVVDTQSRQTLPFGGDVGELMTSGPQVVAGYWRKPEESAAAFENGWLRTGDIGRVDARGWFYVVDRTKDMIVASGFKVWPREVEDVLHEHPGVSEAAVVGVPDSYRGEAPKAFVVMRPGAQVSPEELSLFCRERLASYKVPRLIEILDALPKTNTGKVLRRVLREGLL